MLEKIILENYTTFKKPTIIDFKADEKRDFLYKENVNEGIIKGALFVGENASGKTNILKAIVFLLEILVGEETRTDFFSTVSFYTNNAKCSFEYIFKINGHILKYKIVINRSKILEEVLFLDESQIISRKNNSGTFTYPEKQEQSFSSLTDKQSAVRTIDFETKYYNDKTIQEWFKFLRNSIYFNCSDQNSNHSGRRLISYKKSDEITIKDYLEKNSTERINKFFSEIGHPQEIIYANETPENQTVSFYSSDKIIAIRKLGTEVYIPFKYESLGNKLLLQILPSFLSVIKNNGIFIVDEFSGGLQNDLEELLVKYFYKYSKKSQLFFTSHSTNLMNQTVNRLDQIYSVYFDPKNGAVVKRFSETETYDAQNLEKMYLNGVFDDGTRHKLEI